MLVTCAALCVWSSDAFACGPLKPVSLRSSSSVNERPEVFFSPFPRRRVVAMMSSEGVEFDPKAEVAQAEEKMAKSVESLKTNLQSLRTGRASPDILSRVTVEYYGAETPLNQLASISVSSGTQLVVSPYDKSSMKDVEAALTAANLGMTPNNDGDVIRLNVPALTEDRRKDIIKQAKAIGEDAKVAIRNIRRSANDDVKKLGKDLSEDQKKDTNDTIQKVTDATIKQIDTIVSDKQKELMKL